MIATLKIFGGLLRSAEEFRNNLNAFRMDYSYNIERIKKRE